MDPTIINNEVISDGESDNSLHRLLKELSDCEEVLADNSCEQLDWSDQALLSGSDTETGSTVCRKSQELFRVKRFKAYS